MTGKPVVRESQSRPKKSNLRKPALITAVGDNITGTIGANARGVAVGKNIIVIGTLKIPILPFIVLILIVVAAAAFFGLRLLGPAKMTGSFNLAVAEFGQMDAGGKVVASPKGKLISQRVFDGLKIELDNLPPTVRANFQPQVWHDSLPIAQKRTRIGIIPGATPQARWAAACSLAQKINARVVIYGNLPAGPNSTEFLPEFAICNYIDLRVDADEIVGPHQLIEGLSTQLISQIGQPNVDLAVNMTINSWTSALSLFSIGIMYDLQGRSDLALGVFQQALNQMKEGKVAAAEVLWFFIGREDLILSIRNSQSATTQVDRAARLTDAQAAFEESLQINPGYARAKIGLGDVYFYLAQDQPSTDRLNRPELANSQKEYQQALQEASNFPGALIDVKARLGLADALILQGEAQRDLGQSSDAGSSFDLAAQTVVPLFSALVDARQYRILAQAYLTLGEAYHEQGHLRLLQGDKTSAGDYFKQASENYGLCIQQKDLAITDLTLANEIVANFCVPYQKSADTALADLSK